jgi:hypothetical protein
VQVTERQTEFLILDIDSHRKRYFPVSLSYALQSATRVWDYAVADERPGIFVFVLKNSFGRSEVFGDCSPAQPARNRGIMLKISFKHLMVDLLNNV